ncbi:MAG TPA: PucR family transcriptional regulator ligand-binding domain-containing protein [Symbiobacteriaceae bacterium]|nr:PucR family transcriptional regulator ligand-binding domain-containing protein [Symbiobacteriaceae bacterium]
MAVTVAEILNLPIMQDAVVVAGAKGLGSDIRWVHVSELLDIARLLKGGELLLTTGMGWSVPPEQQVRYVFELAERHVAAVAISLAAFGREVPPAMIAAADQVDLPLIAFTRECAFVQLTEEVHTLIVNRHYAQFRQAEEVAHQLNRAALQKQDATEILRILYQVVKSPVACVSYDENGRGGRLGAESSIDWAERDEGRLRSYYPPGEWGAALIAELAERDPGGGPAGGDEPAALGAGDPAAPLTVPVRLGRRTVDVWLQPILVSGERWGSLAVLQSGRHLTEVERLVVDRAAVTLAYEILRRRSLREQRRGTLSRLAESLLCGPISDVNQVFRRARGLGHELEDRWFSAAVVQPPATARQTEVEQRTVATCARIGLGHLFTWKAGRMHLVLYAAGESGLRSQMAALARELEPSPAAGKGAAPAGLMLGFGRIRYGPERLDESRKQAEFTIALREAYPDRSTEAFFDTTGVHRLFVSGIDPEELHRFVQEELGALLHLEGSERALMLESLRIMLDTNLAVASASRLLGLSRQTVYQRRARLEELLRCQLDCPQKRLSLSLALNALDFESLTAAGTLGQVGRENR